ncbi:small GTP-binding protein sar1 [Reticulomyxa filosa]|uniref:Small GTP-binding protein sar1 n=1 Tax=Reticulomyxa filosa TaxID=46433 RepID=X6NA19_RETFI|nr:small GTP-binding protein sar1 [Reticulomyxa filosa]|eukprot:ETO22604.1 small GTP-binding protein sar1 [Reticulomyxa filosa]
MSFLWNWFFKALNYIGLANKDATILFLGLDNAGKTTLLHVLRDNQAHVSEPTRHATSEDLVMGSVKFTTYDLGGHYAARRIWKDYCHQVDGIVFLVDAADSDRFEESRKELTNLLSSQDLKDVPFLVLGNKVDKKVKFIFYEGKSKLILTSNCLFCLKGAVGEKELRSSLSLTQTTGKTGTPEKGSRPVELFMCSVIKRKGFADGFKWLANFIE